MFLTLENQGLIGTLEYHQDSRSYIVRLYMASDFKTPVMTPWVYPFYYISFGNGITAEDKLLELMEYPAWTCLKFG